MPLRLKNLRRQALALYRLNRLGELASVCSEIVKLDAGDTHAKYLLGIALQSKGNLKEAARCLSEAAEETPDNPAYVFAAANILGRLGRYSASMHFFSLFVAFHPSPADAWAWTGAACCAMGRFQNAVAAFKKALAIEPTHVDALINLGNALQELGRKKSAAACYRRALMVKPDSADAWYNLHAAVFRDDDPSEAIGALRGAIRANPRHTEAKLYGAMLLDHVGARTEARELFRDAERSAPCFSYLAESWCYIQSKRTAHTRLFAVTFDALRFAFSQAARAGLMLEFGVRYATTLNFLALQTRGQIHGFDSFSGLPEAWKGQQKGLYSTGDEVPDVHSNVVLHRGWFEEILPDFCEQNRDNISFMNIDCDLYSSTKTVFDNLRDRLRPGSVIVFDEYVANPRWQEDEFKAFQEVVEEQSLRYEYLLFSPFSKQAAVMIK